VVSDAVVPLAPPPPVVDAAVGIMPVLLLTTVTSPAAAPVVAAAVELLSSPAAVVPLVFAEVVDVDAYALAGLAGSELQAERGPVQASASRV
jgi:hypothetical protein